MELIEKWLLRLEDDKLVITSKKTSKHAPINRVLDEVGLYDFEPIKIDNKTYIVVSDFKEIHKTRVLVMKTLETPIFSGVVDLEEIDKTNMELIADKFLRTKSNIVS
ncbi:hypothetical protein [Acholeplasma granularum]|uniref:hypothetical protein n=1 Tax=Acholeplasma granularum TaxID=264635 RepID=UPI00046F0295|nr:hypothetical protein [Acholeplasma granularum]